MKQIKVSIIMPVYNTQEYVQQAVESLMNQTLRELEIIIIDDGSTDKSGEILAQLSKQDERIQLHHQQNQGQSVARNLGAKYATGKFIYFMDSDDMLQLDALETCYNLAFEHSLEVICFDATIINDEGITSMKLEYDRHRCLREKELTDGTDMMYDQLKQGRYTPSPCLNLISREYYLHVKLSFYPGIIHEDQLFNALLYLQSHRVMYLNCAFYKRRMRANSVMTTPFTWRNMKGYLTVTRELLLIRSKLFSNRRPVIKELLNQMLNAAVWQAHQLPLGQRLALLCICLTKYRAYVRCHTLGVMLFKKYKNKRA